ncbi:MAG: FG-GAP repeat protein [FCB group bacterium]|nr:FG-GAP repeat protein [FCB group bacterium]
MNHILIGAPHHYEIIPAEGAAYLYFGSDSMDTVYDMEFHGEYWYHWLGENVSGAGDVNGDGYNDWLINSPWDDIAGRGRIYLYYGSENPDPICDVYFEGNIADWLRFKDPRLGNINGDRFNDLIFWREGASRIEIHLGSENMDTIPDLAWGTNIPLNPYFYPGSMGDLNDDGYDDWWILKGEGMEYQVYFGSQVLDAEPDLTFEPQYPVDNFNMETVSGDINGDNIDDFIIGGYDAGFYNAEYVIGYLGGSQLDSLPDYIMYGIYQNEHLGATVGVADINGDGIFEALSGASQYVPGSPSNYGPGRVWLFDAPMVDVADNEPAKMPESFVLHPAYPNPFNPATTITFSLAREGEVKLDVFDITGRPVAVLHATPLQGRYSAGTHSVVWDAEGLSSGIYFVRLQTDEGVQSQKLLLLK